MLFLYFIIYGQTKKRKKRNYKPMDFTIRLANKNILIHSVYSSIYNLCKDYLSTDVTKPDFEIHSDDNQVTVEYERIREIDESITSLQSAERLLIQRKIAESLINFDTLLMHGAVIAVDNNAHMFTARSGTGKTTQIKKWLANIEGSVVVNGDKPFVILNENGVFACGTPWCGKENMGNNLIVPLRSIVLMQRSNENRIEKASIRNVFPSLIEQTYQPMDVDLQRKTLALLTRLNKQVDLYTFYFDHYKKDSFKVPYEALTNKVWDISNNE